MTVFAVPEIAPLGATALLARFGERIDRALALRIAQVVAALDRAGLPGVVDLIPSYTTLLVLFDPERADRDTLAETIEHAWAESADHPDAHDPGQRLIEIPVVYGGDAGPDLADVARHTGLPPDEVARRHSMAEYTVGAVGFSPGFAFLIGLPPELETPRRASPRTRVPPGSVGVAGGQTGIYSLPTPGGWSLIGRTPRVMFDPAAADAELRPGDRVRFVPIDAGDAPDFPEPALGVGDAGVAGGALEIVEAGVQTTVQDLGRPGQGRSGITPGGALDRSALVAGNRLLGNDDGAAALEWTLLPPVLRFHAVCRVALTGADPGWRLGGRIVRIGEVVDAAPGEELRASPAATMPGARGYVCVGSGIDVPPVRGGRALDLSAGFGGGYGRPLRAGDRLPIQPVADSPQAEQTMERGEPADPAAEPFRVVRGPQADRFDEAGWSMFLTAPFTVDAQSNRMGLRLNGPALVSTGGADIVSEGVVTGAIQVTGSGQPIVLLPGRATIGGYAKIATVIEMDHDRLGQLRPGAAIRFAEVSLDEAEAALRAWRPSIHGGLAATDEEMRMTDVPDIPDMPDAWTPDAWTPDGVIRVIRELARHDVRAFSLRVESAGLEIAIDRGGLPGQPGRVYEHRAASTSASAGGDEDTDHPGMDRSLDVTAPLLGTFWRRPSPDTPPYVEEGDTIEAGQTIGVIEVMKSFHEVTATAAGVVRRILVDDGATVEYGQPLVVVDPPPEG
jgi:KipI family sensor histidine kinase inhibitor